MMSTRHRDNAVGVLHPILPMHAVGTIVTLMLCALAFGALLVFAYDRGRRS